MTIMRKPNPPGDWPDWYDPAEDEEDFDEDAD